MLWIFICKPFLVIVTESYKALSATLWIIHVYLFLLFTYVHMYIHIHKHTPITYIRLFLSLSPWWYLFCDFFTTYKKKQDSIQLQVYMVNMKNDYFLSAIYYFSWRLDNVKNISKLHRLPHKNSLQMYNIINNKY